MKFSRHTFKQNCVNGRSCQFLRLLLAPDELTVTVSPVDVKQQCLTMRRYRVRAGFEELPAETS